MSPKGKQRRKCEEDGTQSADENTMSERKKTRADAAEKDTSAAGLGSPSASRSRALSEDFLPPPPRQKQPGHSRQAELKRSTASVKVVDPPNVSCAGVGVGAPTLDYEFKLVSFYNHKGGVGKTTNLHATAFELAKMGERVLMVDADPQRNLTQYCLHFAAGEWAESHQCQPDFRELCRHCQNEDTVMTMVSGFTQGVVPHVRVPQLWGFASFPHVFLLAGDEKIVTLDETLAHSSAVANMSPQIAQIAKTHFGMWYHCLKTVAREHQITTVLVDLSPASGLFNRTAFLCSHYVVCPAQPDYFSKEALLTLSEYLPQWIGVRKSDNGAYNSNPYIRIFDWSQHSLCPLPDDGSPGDTKMPRLPKFLGLIVSRVGYRKGGQAMSFNLRQAMLDIQMANSELIRTLTDAKPGEPDISSMSMDSWFPGYYDHVAKYCVPEGDGMRRDARKGTISVVREFHQLSFLGQRLSLPVSCLSTLSPLFKKFDVSQAEEYESRISNSRDPLHPSYGKAPEVQTAKNWLCDYTSQELSHLDRNIDTAHTSFERVAALIAWLPSLQ